MMVTPGARMEAMDPPDLLKEEHVREAWIQAPRANPVGSTALEHIL